MFAPAPTFSLRGLLLAIGALALAFAYFRPAAPAPVAVGFQPGEKATSFEPAVVSDDSLTQALLADDAPTLADSIVCYAVPTKPDAPLRRLPPWTTSGRCLAVVYGDWSDHLLDSRTPGLEGSVQRGGRLIFVTEGLTRSPLVTQLDAATGRRTPHWFLASAPPWPYVIPGAVVIWLDTLVGVLVALAAATLFWRPHVPRLKRLLPWLTIGAGTIGMLSFVLAATYVSDVDFWNRSLSAHWRFGAPGVLTIVMFATLTALWLACRRDEP